LGYDEEIVLTWKNSLFGLMVTEVFVARAGHLELTRITFADPRGLPPPVSAPEDLDNLYHTGGRSTSKDWPDRSPVSSSGSERSAIPS